MNARVSASSCWPDERNTSSTIGGALSKVGVAVGVARKGITAGREVKAFWRSVVRIGFARSHIHFCFGGTGDFTPLPIFLSVTVIVFTGSIW